METKELTIWDIITKHRESADLRSRYVGCAPTYEWTGLATKELQDDLNKVHVAFEYFYSDVKGQECHGKKCVVFVTFGEIWG